MSWFDIFRKRRYRAHPDAVIISSYFNPMHSPYRRQAFLKWYRTIMHLNHQIIECVIGEDKPELPENENIRRIQTQSLLWHKEGLLNALIEKLPRKFKYVFWVDADVLFTNLDWLSEGVKQLQNSKTILQPFEFCVHLEKDQTEPDFKISDFAATVHIPEQRKKTLWRSFSANYVRNHRLSESTNYDAHGHVGFAWGARRSVLEKCPFYDRALIGGADHILAHAAAGQIPSACIRKAFADDIEEVERWSRRFKEATRGAIGFVPGNLYHLWHGDIDRRQYMKRIRDFTARSKDIQERDEHGLFVNRGSEQYVRGYFQHREVMPASAPADNSFFESMALGYMTDSFWMGMLIGGNPVGAMLGSSLADHHHHDEPKADPPAVPDLSPPLDAPAQKEAPLESPTAHPSVEEKASDNFS